RATHLHWFGIPSRTAARGVLSIMSVVITGANRGIGLELVRQLIQRETSIIATARRPEEALELSALAEQFAGRLRIHSCDVSWDESVAAFAKEISDVPIDLLINNAG